jgi:UMF1 family MFS transporter
VFNRQILVWASYDIASSTYVAVPVVLFPIYFRSVVIPGTAGDLYLGLTIASALIIAGLSAPFLGMLADRKDARWGLLVAASVGCCLALASLTFVDPAGALPVAIAFAVAHAGYLLATSLYDSYLPHIAEPSRSGRVSGLGWALGFVGGAMAIMAILPLAGGGTGRQFLDSYLSSFVVIAAMFALLAVPALAGLRHVVEKSGRQRRYADARALQSVLAIWRDHPQIAKLLVAIYLINDGMVTISVFAANYFRTQFGTSVDQLLFLLLVYHLVALPATLAFGYLADVWSTKKAIGASLSIWVGVLVLMTFGTAPWIPAASVVLLGCVFGSTMAMLRGLLARMVPVDRAAEFFGFNMLAGRLSAALGPLLFGLIAAATGSQRAAVASILAFIVGGVGVLVTVRTSPLR